MYLPYEQEHQRCTGRLPSPRDPRNLKLSNYIDLRRLGAPPTSHDWVPPLAKWEALGNNQYGDCVFAGMAHHVQQWCTLAGHPWIPTEREVVDAYFSFTNGRDVGANILEVVKLFRNKGLWGHRGWAFVQLDPHDHDAVKWAIKLFGSIKTGVSMPATWRGQSEDYIWDIGRGSWGGHDVPVMYYDADYLDCISWGYRQRMTWKAWDYYFDEAIAIISPDWIMPNGLTPEGVDLVTLRQEADALSAA